MSIGLLGCGLLAGCASAVDGAEDTNGSLSQAVDAPSASAGYVTVRRDLGTCPAPMCGGYWVKPLVGSGPEIYAASLDFGKLGLSTDEESALREDVEHLVLTGRVLGTPGAFIADSAFTGHGVATASASAFYVVKSTPIVCFVAPCRNIEQTAVAGKRTVTMIASVDFSQIAGDTSDASALLASKGGLLVAGTPSTIEIETRTAPALRVTSYFTPVVHTEPQTAAVQSCGSRGQSPCGEGSYCNFPASANCGRSDASGVCTPVAVNALCTQVLVCGCDGQTYGSPCAAAAAGVSVETLGACGEKL